MKSRFAGLGFVLSSCLLVNPPSDVLPDVTVGGSAGIGGAGAGETGAAAGGKTGSSAAAGAMTTSAGGSTAGAHPVGGAGSSAGTTHSGGGGGTGGRGGTGGSAPLGTFACANAIPSGALITSFADLVPNPSNKGNFNFVLGVPGGTYAYQPDAMVLTVTSEQALNIKGTVAASSYDGFGLYFNTCIDASAYTGVSFNLKGNAGPSNALDFRIRTNSNTEVDPPNMKGTCIVPAGTGGDAAYGLCHAAHYLIAVPASGGLVNVKFSSLSDGAPIGLVTGKEILFLEWAFTPSSSSSYPVDVTIDNVQFTGDPATNAGSGDGGAAGDGGGALSGSGGA